MDFFKGDNKDSPVSAAMDFFKGDKKDAPATTTAPDAAPAASTTGGELQKKSSTELLASAKLVSEAAQAALNNKSDTVDKQKVAGAAADLLDAAQGYGKLGQDGVGKYVDQAEEYLKKYSHGSDKTAASTAATTTTTAPATTTDTTAPAPAAAATPAAADEKSGSDYLKMAQGFLGKH